METAVFVPESYVLEKRIQQLEERLQQLENPKERFCVGECKTGSADVWDSVNSRRVCTIQTGLWGSAEKVAAAVVDALNRTVKHTDMLLIEGWREI